MKKVIGTVLLIIVLVGAVYAGTRPEDMTIEQKNKELVEVALFAIEEGNWELMAKLFSPRYVQHDPGNKKTINWKEFELGCRIAHNKLPTSRCEIEDIIAEADKVAVRLKTVVTYKTWDHREVKIEFAEMDMFRIEGSTIVEEWCEYDTVDWKQKLWKIQHKVIR
ncbi:hypothetical protein ES702_06457 [subsurface metagenome]